MLIGGSPITSARRGPHGAWGAFARLRPRPVLALKQQGRLRDAPMSHKRPAVLGMAGVNTRPLRAVTLGGTGNCAKCAARSGN